VRCALLLLLNVAFFAVCLQLNSYYAAGRVMVPALLDTFTCQGFFKRRALLDLLTELAGAIHAGCLGFHVLGGLLYAPAAVA
jgi:hypothetical protein